MPDDPDPDDSKTAWETPGSSRESAIAVGACAAAGATAAVGAGSYVLLAVGLPESTPALYAALAAAGGIGAGIGAWLGWAGFGKD